MSAALVALLKSSAGTKRLQALRDIKNQVIGNRAKKCEFIKFGAVEVIADLIDREADDADIVQQAAVALGRWGTCKGSSCSGRSGRFLF